MAGTARVLHHDQSKTPACQQGERASRHSTSQCCLSLLALVCSFGPKDEGSKSRLAFYAGELLCCSIYDTIRADLAYAIPTQSEPAKVFALCCHLKLALTSLSYVADHATPTHVETYP